MQQQWSRPCTELPSFVIKCLPVRLTFDNNYFNALYQGIPIGGYTRLVENLLDGIEVRLDVNYLEHKGELDAPAEKLVEIRGLFVEEIHKISMENVKRLYRLI